MDERTLKLLKDAMASEFDSPEETAELSPEEEALWEIFEEQPVTLNDFIWGEDYLNQPELVLSDLQYDLVRHFEQVLFLETYELMAEAWGEYWTPVRMVNTLVAAIGKGGGKDLCIQIAFARIAYILLCLKSPQKYYKAPEFTPIHMMNVAVSSNQAQEIFFIPMIRLLKNSKWFEDKFAHGIPGPRAGAIHLIKNIEMVSGHSQADSLEGKNLICAVADEIAAFPTDNQKKGDSTRTASYIVNMLNTSAVTRFPKTFKVVLISFARYQGDPILTALESAKEDEALNGDTSTFYACGPYATWDFNPRYQRTYEFIDIPQTDVPVPKVDFILTMYRKSPGKAKGYFECKPEASENAYYKDKEKVRNSFSRQLAVPPLSVGYYFGKDEMDDKEKYASWQVDFVFSPDLKPVPGAIYAIHADMALKDDRAGIAMCHVSHYREVETSTSDGSDRIEQRPVVKLDFVTAFEYDAAALDPDGNSVPREIQVRWFRKLVMALSDRGFTFGSVSQDGWQCLSGDTRIPLLDGTKPTIEELADREEEFYLYSIDTESGAVVPGKALRAYRSGSEHVYRVLLDNGECVEATAGHKFMLRDGTYKLLSDLVAGDSLMPFYRRDSHKVVSVEYAGNKKVYDIEVEKYHNFAVQSGVFVHNSTDSLQILQSWGYEAHKLSTDVVTTPCWQTLRDLMYDGRLDGYNHKLLVNELLALEKQPNGKIDHPAHEGKDLADAVAASATMAVEVGGQEEDENTYSASNLFGSAGDAFGLNDSYRGGYVDDFGQTRTGVIW